MMALTSYIGGMILFGLSHTVTAVFLSSCLGSGPGWPSLSSAPSYLRYLHRILHYLYQSYLQHVHDDEIGKVFGVSALQGDLSLIIGQNLPRLG